MRDWLANVKDPDKEKEMSEKRLYVDPDDMKPKEEIKSEEVNPEDFKTFQNNDVFDDLVKEFEKSEETKPEEYHLQTKRYEDQCPGYIINADGKITNLAVNVKHGQWDKTITEIISKIRQYYFYNNNMINNLSDGNNGNSLMFDNEIFITNQKIISILNEKFKDLSQTIFTSFHMLFDRLKYEINIEYTGNQEFAKVIGKFMDNLNNVLLVRIYEIMTRLNNDYGRCSSNVEFVNNHINKIIHFNQVDYYKFSRIEDLIGFYRTCYEDKLIIDEIKDSDKYVIMSYICREMAIINKEIYKISCYLVEVAQTPNIRYNTLYNISEITDDVSNFLFDDIIEVMQLMIEQIIKGWKYQTEIYERDFKKFRLLISENRRIM